MSIWTNAFKIPQKKVLKEEEKIFIEKFTNEIKKRNLSMPSAILVEGTLPMHNITSQLIVFAFPFLRFIFKEQDINTLVDILQNPAALEYFKEKID